MSRFITLWRRLGKEDGQAMVIAIAIVTVGLLLGLAAVGFALTNTQQTGHDRQTRASQQAATSGVQQQLLNQSDSDAVGYNVTGGPLGLSSLLACTVPEINAGVQVNTIQVAANAAGVCPSAVTSACLVGAQAGSASCPVQTAPWTPDSDGSYFESELLPNATTQPTSSSSAYAVEFPEIVSVGCHTTQPSPISSCDGGASTNAYSRQLALLKPTSPLQAVEAENNVTINSTPAGLSNALAVIDGNIVAGNNLHLPTAAAALNLSGSNVLNWLVGSLEGGLTGQTSIGSPTLNVQASLSYGSNCYVGSASCVQGSPSADPLGADVSAATGGASNVCTAGKPSTNCWLHRSTFNLNDPSAVNCGGPGGTGGAGNTGISYSTGTGTCVNGSLSATGNVTLASGHYVFCGVSVAGSISNSTGGAVQVYVAGPGEDGCPNALRATVSAAPTSTGSLTDNFTAQATGGSGSGYTYAWKFGDPTSTSNTSTSQNPQHTFTGAGTYNATLTVSDSVGDTVTYAVAVNITTTALSFKTLACTSTGSNSISCTAAAQGGTGTYSSYSWNFGDGTTGTGATATHSYTQPGTYTVVVTVTDSSGATLSAPTTLTVTSPLTVATPTCTLNTSSTVTCSETTPTTGFGSDTYSWNFGDGSTATGQSAMRTYSNNGGYTISVTVTDAAGQTGSASTNATVTGVALVTAGMTASVSPAPTTSTVGSSVSPNAVGNYSLVFGGITFSNAKCDASGITCAYSWTLGGPSGGGTLTNSTAQAPTITFTKAGTYYATVAITGSYGSGGMFGTKSVLGTATAASTIVVAPKTTPASLTATGSISSISGDSVTFAGSAAGGTSPDTYSWNFGDGSAASTSQNPTYTYAVAGTYPVVLTVTDSAGNTATYATTAIVGSSATASTLGTTVTITQTASSSTGVPAGSFTATGGINNVVDDVVNGLVGATAGIQSVDPSAFQIYVQGDQTADSWEQGGQGSARTPTTSVNIDTSMSSSENAAVVYAPLSTVTVDSPLLFEGSLIGWNVNVTSLGVVEDLDLGNYPLSSAVNSYQVAQNVECSTAVTKLTANTTDLSGC